MKRPLLGLLSLLSALTLATPAWAEPTTDTVYSDGQVYEADVGGQHVQYTTSQQPGDPLVLSSGALAASDAFLIFAVQPAQPSLAPGQYPVVLTVTRDNTGEVLVAYARVDLAPGQATHWQPATSFATDSGIGVFLDADAASHAAQDYNPYGTQVFGALTDALARNEFWTSVLIDPDSGADAVVFTTGHGQGGYTTYWGLDDNEQPVALVADFNVLGPAVAAPSSPPPSPDNPPPDSDQASD
jgi:hypothetical protein